jgi:hypothetical protein
MNRYDDDRRMQNLPCRMLFCVMIYAHLCNPGLLPGRKIRYAASLKLKPNTKDKYQ